MIWMLGMPNVHLILFEVRIFGFTTGKKSDPYSQSMCMQVFDFSAILFWFQDSTKQSNFNTTQTSE